MAGSSGSDGGGKETEVEGDRWFGGLVAGPKAAIGGFSGSRLQ